MKVLNYQNTPNNANITLYIKKIKTLCKILNWGNWNSGFIKLGVRWAERDIHSEIYWPLDSLFLLQLSRREKHRGTLTVSMMQIWQLLSRLFLRLERAILEKNAMYKVAPEIFFQPKDGAIFSSIAKLIIVSIVMIF